MKNYLLLMAAGAFLCSCPKEKLSAPNPEFEYFVIRNTDTIMSPDTVEVGEVVYFRNEGSGELFSVFPGETGRSSFNTQETPVVGAQSNVVGDKGAGVALRRTGLYYQCSYQYRNQGSYEIVYVSTSTANYASESESKVSRNTNIIVVDRRTSISNVYVSSWTSKKSILSKSYVPGDTVYVPVKFGFKDNVTIKFQAGNASATRNDVPVAVDGIEYRDQNVDISKPVIYTITAADGLTTRNVVFVLKVEEKAISDNNLMTSITVSNVIFSPKADSSFVLLYPHGKTSATVTFVVDAYSSIIVGTKTFKPTDAITVADLNAAMVSGKGVVKVISESKIPASYKFTCTEETLKASPIAFDQATGFPVVAGTGDTLNIYLSASLDIKKLTPRYPSSSFTVIKYGINQTVFNNGLDVIDFSSPVSFVLENGDQKVVQVLVVKTL